MNSFSYPIFFKKLIYPPGPNRRTPQSQLAHYISSKPVYANFQAEKLVDKEKQGKIQTKKND